MCDMPTPADIVIKRFGSPKAVADALGVHVAQVYKCRKGRKRSPAGSLPSHWHGPLLEKARERGISLRPAELVLKAAA